MNQLTAEQQALLLLLQKSLWKESIALPEIVNWKEVDAAANKHAIVPLVYDGAVAMQAPIPPEILRGWKKILLAGILRNEKLLIAQDALISGFAQANIPAVILKGSSVSRYYPQPGLRILGDIDILVGKEHVAAAQKLIESHGYKLCESEHNFHIGFGKPGAYVELHYEVTSLPNSPGGRVTREVTAQFLENIHQGTVDSHRFPVLSEPHQAVMLLLHMIRHMFDVGIGLRQLCDWAAYLNSTDAMVFAQQTIPLLSQCGLLQYAKVATGTCIHYLGLPEKSATWCADVKIDACRAFLADILRSGNFGAANEAMGSLFTDSEIMGTKQSAVEALIIGANRLAYMHFPPTKKFKILLPLVWIYLPLRYFVRSLLGLRPKKSAVTVVASAKQRRKLYEMLDMFEIPEK